MKKTVPALVMGLGVLATSQGSFGDVLEIDQTVEFNINVLPAMRINGAYADASLGTAAHTESSNGLLAGTTSVSAAFNWFVESNVDVKINISGQNPQGFPNFNLYGPAAARWEVNNGVQSATRYDRLVTNYHAYVTDAPNAVITTEGGYINTTKPSEFFAGSVSDRVFPHDGTFNFWLDGTFEHHVSADAGTYRAHMMVLFQGLPP